MFQIGCLIFTFLFSFYLIQWVIELLAWIALAETKKWIKRRGIKDTWWWLIWYMLTDNQVMMMIVVMMTRAPPYVSLWSERQRIWKCVRIALCETLTRAHCQLVNWMETNRNKWNKEKNGNKDRGLDRFVWKVFTENLTRVHCQLDVKNSLFLGLTMTVLQHHLEMVWITE